MKNIILPILIFLLAGLYSCKENAEIPPEINNGGIVMSLDDRYVSEWYEADSRLANYNWKATFCISSYSKLSLNEVFKLHELVGKGHEVAGHGLDHLSAVKISDSLGVDEYLNMEIYPMLDLMEKDGFNVKSFAYPGGSNNKQTDEALLGIFGTLRGVGWSTNYSNAIRKSFFEGFPVVYSFGIDEHKSYFAGLDYNQCILEALTYARDNNKILLVHGHETVETVTDEYQTSFATLDMICNFIIENNMKFYTLSELKGMVNQ